MNSSQILSLAPNHFSLENYLKYIGLNEITPLQANLDTLKKIITHHNMSFPYHNFQLFNASKLPASDRVIPSLDKDNLFEHMLKNHGGYCYQQLELLHAALSALGFKLDRYLAKIILQPCSKMNASDNEEIKTHELLAVSIDETKYIIDSGMANMSLREPLELKEGTQIIDDDQYKLTKSENNRWSLDTRTNFKYEWLCMYQFFAVNVTYEEIVKYHTELYLTPDYRAIRDDRYLTGITTTEKRKYIRWLYNQGSQPDQGIFSSIKKNNAHEKKRELASLQEAIELSRKKFGIS